MLSTLGAPRHLAYFFFLGTPVGVAYAVGLLFLLYLLHSMTRRIWLARLLLFLEFLVTCVVAFASGGGQESGRMLAAGLGLSAIICVVLVRLGLVSSVMLWFTNSVLLRAPLTLDWSAWYAGRSFAVLGFFAAVLVAAFYTSLGGRPVFGKALLDD